MIIVNSIYAHTRICNRSGERDLALLWTFLHGDPSYSNLQVGLKQSLEKNFFCFRAGFICKPQEEENTRERGVWCSAAITVRAFSFFAKQAFQYPPLPPQLLQENSWKCFRPIPFPFVQVLPLPPSPLLPFPKRSRRWDFGAVSLRGGGLGGEALLGFAGCAAFAPRRGASGAQGAEGCAEGGGLRGRGGNACGGCERGAGGTGRDFGVFSLQRRAGHGRSCALLPRRARVGFRQAPGGVEGKALRGCRALGLFVPPAWGRAGNPPFSE